VQPRFQQGTAIGQTGKVTNEPRDTQEPQRAEVEVEVEGEGGKSEALVAEPVPAPVPDDASAEDSETIERPAKVMRIGSMIRQLLDEARQAPLDEASRARLREIYAISLREIQEGLSADLGAELTRMAPTFESSAVPSEGELRVAQAQLVGWLEGLFHGIQATMYAQQMAQRAQLEEARRRGLPSGVGSRGDADDQAMPGTYL